MNIRKHSVSGVALIIVLGFLVIISALAVAFFSSVNTELKASRNFAAGITTRQLADSSVQVVMGQIANATTRGIDAQGLGHEAWASQPGMIRVFGQNTGSTYSESSAPDAFFKLYSSDKMILTGGELASFRPSEDYLPSWSKSPAYWTDLNAPVIVRDSSGLATPRFPIIDPRAYVTAINPQNPTWGNNVEGFYYDASVPVDGIVGPGSPDAQRLPMPVRWIYVLQDGTLTTPDSNGSGVTATFDTAPPAKKPSLQNPIVGRVAFWTDDETCKLNLNTAAGYNEDPSKWGTSLPNASAYQAKPSAYAGSYWDSPRFYTQFDYGIPTSTGTPATGQASGGLALCQLLQNEFQRYPGHPATTSLAPVLQNLVNSEQIYAIVPRYSITNISNQVASTKGGTDRVIVDNTIAGVTTDDQQIQPKQDRLYATPDEFLFGAHVKGVPSNSPSYARVTNNTYGNLPGQPSGPITPQVVDRLNFFITAQGRSPELNLFGQPRVSCWPVRAESTSETTGMNVFDNLIVFCSTVGSVGSAGGKQETKQDQSGAGIYRYIFTRREINNATMTSQISHTYAGGIIQKQWELNSTYTDPLNGAMDWKRSRNSTLLTSYLGHFVDSYIPGVGQVKFTQKYPADMGGILMEIFDYVRLANSQDTTTSLAPPAKAIKFAPTGYVAPSKPVYNSGIFTNSKGFGRMSTICEATLCFYYAGPQMDAAYAPPSGASPNTGWSKWDPAAPTSRYCKVDANGFPAGGYMRAFLVFSMFDPMQGYAPKADPAAKDPKLSIECTWSQDFRVTVGGNSYNLGFPTGGAVSNTIYRAPGSVWGGRNFGGYEGFLHTLQGLQSGDVDRPMKIMWSPTTPLVGPAINAGATDYGETMKPGGSVLRNDFANYPANMQEYYPFQTNIANAVPIPGPNVTGPSGQLPATFDFTGGDITVKLYYGGSNTNSSSPVLQTFTLSFPNGSSWPVPQGAPRVLQPVKAPAQTVAPTRDVTTWAACTDADSYGTAPSAGNQLGAGGKIGMRHYYWTNNGCFLSDMAVGRTPVLAPFVYTTSLQASWSLATRIAWVTSVGGDSTNPHTNSSNGPIAPGYWGDRFRCIFQPGDTVRSLVYWDAKNALSQAALSGAGPIRGGDLRIGALMTNVPNTQFMPHPDYAKNYSRACILRGGDGGSEFPVGNIQAVGTPSGITNGGGGSPAPVLALSPDPTKEAVLGNHIFLGSSGTLKMQQSRAFGNLPWGGGTNISNTAGVNGVNRPDNNGQYPGDFDTGLGNFPDGPFCNKQDEGNVIWKYLDTNTNQWVYPIPYFTSTWSYQKPGDTFTSPSRQMPSPAMFGSLPAYPVSGRGWTTLSFAPNTAGDMHPGNSIEPKDHYLLDLFQMPVVEPYPISEPFSTAGKVNLNYRIAPFDYIRRSTALRGALYPLRVTAVNSQYQSPSSSSNYLTYKIGFPSGTPLAQNFRLRLDRNETIKSFDGFFDEGLTDLTKGFFRSASQICERYFYSQDSNAMSYAGTPGAEATFMRGWWTNFGDLTGDNEREKPYVDLYPRVTTKSNTYTVHMRVQTLRQSPGHPATQWVEGKDAVLGEYRGSATIERYIDPADPRFTPGNSPFFNPDQKSVEPLYRFRTVYTKKFTQ